MMGTHLTLKWSPDYGCPLKKRAWGSRASRSLCLLLAIRPKRHWCCSQTREREPQGKEDDSSSKDKECSSWGVLGQRKAGAPELAAGEGGKQGRGFLQMLEGQPGTPRGLQRRKEGLRRASSACPLMWASRINHLVYKLGKDETRFALP